MIQVPNLWVDEVDDDQREGFGWHGCCCDHVVEELVARPGSAHDHHEDARDRWYECPHRTLTPLEVYLGTLPHGA